MFSTLLLAILFFSIIVCRTKLDAKKYGENGSYLKKYFASAVLNASWTHHTLRACPWCHPLQFTQDARGMGGRGYVEDFRLLSHSACHQSRGWTRRHVHAGIMPGLLLGDVFPDFEAETTVGKIKLHQFLGDSWVVLMIIDCEWLNMGEWRCGSCTVPVKAFLTSAFDQLRSENPNLK